MRKPTAPACGVKRCSENTCICSLEMRPSRMVTKTCTGCGVQKELDDFGVQPRGLYGRRSKCKACTCEYNRSYHKTRWQSDEVFRLRVTERAAKWAIANPLKRSEIAIRRNKKELRENPDAVKARALVNQRVRFGRMPKASSLECVQCGGIAAHYHHHKGYAFENRYDVKPVCAPCHKLLG